MQCNGYVQGVGAALGMVIFVCISSLSVVRKRNSIGFWLYHFNTKRNWGQYQLKTLYPYTLHKDVWKHDLNLHKQANSATCELM